MAIMDDMDICLNITANPKRPAKYTSEIVRDMSIKRLKKHSDDKVTKSFKKNQSIDSSKTLLVGAKKRIKQKNLASIVSKNFKRANPSTIVPKSILKKSTPSISTDISKSSKNEKKINEKSSIKESKSNFLKDVGSKTSEISASFTKTLKDVSVKTILARKRKANTDGEKKSLANVFKVEDSKETKLIKTNNDADNKSIDKNFKKIIQNKSKSGKTIHFDDSSSVESLKKSKVDYSKETKLIKTNNDADNKSIDNNFKKTVQNKSKPDKTIDFDDSCSPAETLKKPRDKLQKNFQKNTGSKKINTHSNKGGKFFSLFTNNPMIPNIGQRFIKPVNEKLFSAEKFSELGIHSFSISNLEQNMNITTMTTVQKKAIPVILSGNDTLIRSQTGSGKTLSYALPIIENLQSVRPKLPRNSGIKALVVLPTRELALQTYECFLKLIKPFTWLVPGYLVGGEKRKAEKARLRKGCTILIATPGRLLDHLKHTKVLKIDVIKYFVLDEADRMFDMGYEKDISEIVAAIENKSLQSDNSGYDAIKILRKHINPNNINENENKNNSVNNEMVNNNLKNKSSESNNSGYDALNMLRQHINPHKNNNENENKSVNNELVDNNLENDSNDKKRIITKFEYNSDTDEDCNQQSDCNVSGPTTTLDNKKERDKQETINDSDKVQKRQTILLSATLTHAVEKLAGLTMHNPVFVDAAKDNSEAIGRGITEANEDLIVPESVTQSYIVTPPKLRMVTLSAYIIGKYQKNKNHKILIFMATQDMIDYHADILSLILNKPIDDEDEDSDALADIEFFKLHGNMSQKDRTEVFKTFKSATSGVLLCTDVAARGLDLPKVDVVVQYTGPTSTRDYVHRIGRTARAGSSGTATIFLTPPEVEFARMLEARRIRIKQDDMDDVLGALMHPLSQKNSVREAAVGLQDDFENSVLQNKKLYAMACKAYTSWVRFYSSYPREMREVFNRKNLHLGHYAKSFALRDPPQKIGGSGRLIREKEEADQPRPKHQNRLSNHRPDGVPEKRVNANRQQDRRNGMLKNVRMLNTSEYASGLEPIKKPKKS